MGKPRCAIAVGERVRHEGFIRSSRRVVRVKGCVRGICTDVLMILDSGIVVVTKQLYADALVVSLVVLIVVYIHVRAVDWFGCSLAMSESLKALILQLGLVPVSVLIG